LFYPLVTKAQENESADEGGAKIAEEGDPQGSPAPEGAAESSAEKEAAPEAASPESEVAAETASAAGTPEPAAPAQPVTTVSDADESDGTEKKDAEKTKKGDKADEKFRVKARVHTRWEMTHHEIEVAVLDDNDDPVLDADGEEMTEKEGVLNNEFKIQRARVKLIFEPLDWVMGLIQVGGFQRSQDAVSLLKDAYLHLSPSRYLELRVGLFKKPFSRLELRGSGRMRIANRGIGNSLIVEHWEGDSHPEIKLNDRLGYGDRDVGLQLSGRLVKAVKLDYEVGVFNGAGPVFTQEGNSKDVVGRITVNPTKWVRFGTNGSVKFFDDDERKGIIRVPDEDGEGWTDEEGEILRNPGWAAGVDTLFKVKGVRLHLEAMMALDYRVVDLDAPPLILNLIAILSYRHKFDVDWKLAVEPVFKMEFLDPNSVYLDDLVLLYSPGFNIYLGDYVRFMIHGEIQRVSRNTDESLVRPRNTRDSEALVLQFCFDI
jgi:hypothetical protein